MLKTANRLLRTIFQSTKTEGDDQNDSIRITIERERRIQNQPTRVFSGSTCEKCGAAGIPIVYGLMAVRSDVVMGGCVVSWDSPRFQCSACDTRWRVSFAANAKAPDDGPELDDRGAVNQIDLISSVREDSRWGWNDHVAAVDVLPSNSEDEISLLDAAKLTDVSIMARLIEAGADPNTADSEGWSALHLAAGSGNVATTELLLRAGADPYVVTPGDWSPLVIAVIGGWVETARALIKHGVDPNHVWGDGHTALYHGVWEGEPETVSALIGMGADPNFRGTGNFSVLWDAAYYNRHEMIPVLVAGGADPNFVGSLGISLLSKAVLMNRPDVVAALATYADVNLVDGLEMSPLDLAKRTKSTEMLEILRA